MTTTNESRKSAPKWGRVPAHELRAHGWVQADGGWRKNGAFFGQWANSAIVGQFADAGLPYRAQMELERRLPIAVKLHLINAMADAPHAMEAEAAR